MKKVIVHKHIPIKASRNERLVGIWWYTDSGEFWSYNKTLDDAEECHGYLQASNSKNHMNLWRSIVNKYIADANEANKITAKGYKSIERGRIVFNIRTQCYEIVCSDELVNDLKFRAACKEYFNLSGSRCQFEALHHYCKQELTGNSAIDELYYD